MSPGAETTGGETSASAVTSIGTGKAAATRTGNGSATSAAGGAHVGGAIAGAVAGVGAGAAAEEKAGTGSTEELEISSQSLSQNVRTMTATILQQHLALSRSTLRLSCLCPPLCTRSPPLHLLESLELEVLQWQRRLTFPTAPQTAGQATMAPRDKMASESRSPTRVLH